MKIGLKISVTFIGFVLLLFLIELFYSFGLKQNINLKLNYIQKNKIDAELLIHGPCEPLWMISPDLLDSKTKLKSYNLALSHSDFADNYLHLYFYLKNNKAPTYLMLYVTPESMDSNYNTFNTYRFAAYLKDAEVKAVVKECDKTYYDFSSIPFLKYAYYNSKINFSVFQGYKHYFTNKKNPYYPSGFEPPANRVWGNHAGEFAALYQENYIFKWNTLREKYLLKTISLAKKYGIKVILYESPILKEALAFQPNRKEILKKIDALAQQQNVPYIRFENLKIAEDKSNFISTLNFNMNGLTLFNDTFAKYINAKIIQPIDAND
jgi:hypothetical protein